MVDHKYWCASMLPKPVTCTCGAQARENIEARNSREWALTDEIASVREANRILNDTNKAFWSAAELSKLIAKRRLELLKDCRAYIQGTCQALGEYCTEADANILIRLDAEIDPTGEQIE